MEQQGNVTSTYDRHPRPAASKTWNSSAHLPNLHAQVNGRHLPAAASPDKLFGRLPRHLQPPPLSPLLPHDPRTTVKQVAACSPGGSMHTM
jgi:hypothetical protein